MIKNLTCIECPIGCSIEVTMEDGKVVSVKGNACPRGKIYAEAEVVCPKRVVTSTVRADNGEMIPVKTDRPVRKDAIFDVMKKINATTCKMPVALGQILVENICDDANLIVAGNF
jgi:CxxC motif-containing protein